MGIIHTRIDSRLIHGQVASMWTNHLGATRIMVVDDDAATNENVKMSLKLATPYGVALSVLPVEKAASRINANAYDGQRVFLIVKAPATLLQLVQKGVVIKETNVGNMTHMEGKIKITNQISVTEEEIEAFKQLKKAGIDISLQLTPSNQREDFLATVEKVVG